MACVFHQISMAGMLPGTTAPSLPQTEGGPPSKY